MAFSISGFYPDSRGGGHRAHSYNSADTVATTSADDYFNLMFQVLNVGDIIACYDSTNAVTYELRIASITGEAVTTNTCGALSAETLITTKAISAAENGKTFYLALADGFTTTLPAPLAGLRFKFIITISPTTAYIIVTNGGADVVVVGVNELEVDTSSDGPYDINADTVNLVANVAVIGDQLNFECDGTKWYMTGQTNADGGVTTSTT